jgi:hypothetical protein
MGEVSMRNHHINNVVINNTTTGITNQGIQLITRPYQERITTLEQKLTEATRFLRVDYLTMKC